MWATALPWLPQEGQYTVPEKQRDSHHHQDTPSEHLKGGKDGSPAFTMEGKLLATTRKQELFHQGEVISQLIRGGAMTEAVHSLQSLTAVKAPRVLRGGRQAAGCP